MESKEIPNEAYACHMDKQEIKHSFPQWHLLSFLILV